MRTNRKPASVYIAYCLVSTARHAASALGRDAQREAVTRLATNAPIRAEYTEFESGNRHENEPQPLAALASAKKHRAVLLSRTSPILSSPLFFNAGVCLQPESAAGSGVSRLRNRR
ncbi:MAG: hypothetical protein ACJ74Z_21945 [Bryobacteraceae bacterium]